MIFSSISFIFYFLPSIILLYYIFKFSPRLKNIILLLGSLVFYSWGNVNACIVLIISILVNYIFSFIVDFFRKYKLLGRITMALMYTFNLGLLFFYKYLGFLSTVVNDIFQTSFVFLDLIPPIGISFFTLKAISYVSDVYKQRIPAQRNLFYSALYMALFPQIISGPVVQYAAILEPLAARTENLNTFSVGCCRFVTGLAKKVIIADQLAMIANTIFALSDASSVTASLAWVGSIAFSLQIFYDLSAYSDMAIGLCLMFGFKVQENVNYPYISTSITEFWKRWHISLIQWFNEYVYTPLGGSRLKNQDKVIRNLFVMWLLIGIWHGAGWHFLIWGLLNFVFLLMEKLLSIDKSTANKELRTLYTLFIVNLLWVVFRSDDLASAGHYIASMFGFNGIHSSYTLMFIKENFMLFVLGAVFATPIAKRMNRLMVEKVPYTQFINALYPVYITAMFIISIAYLVKNGASPFIFGGQ